MKQKALLGLSLACALAAAGCAGDTTHVVECRAAGGLEPVCGFQNPEDLVVFGDEDPWLLVSQFPQALADSVKPGAILAFRPEDGRRVQLHPLEGGDAAAPAREGDAACTAPPDPTEFAPHGIDLAGDRLLVVNHGGREAIEIFAVTRGEVPSLQWIGCVFVPDEAMANDVAAHPEGGFVVTEFMPRHQTPLTMLQVIMGWDTGKVWQWSPEGGWNAVANSEDSAPNGVAVTADGRQAFYGAWGRQAVVRVDLQGGARREVDVGFYVDNLSWAPDGSLLAAGQGGSLTGITSCLELVEGTCGMPSYVAAVDPRSLEATLLVQDDPAVVSGAASVAVEHRGVLWIGTFSGDRLVRTERTR